MSDKNKKDNLKLYGTIEGHQGISFVLDNFQCVFFANSITNKKAAETIIPVHGFVIGKTTENKYVYIPASRNFKVMAMATLDTWLYFVSGRKDIDSFEAISFQGGTLDKLFIKSSSEFDYDDPTKVIYKDDRKIYSLTDKKIKGELSIRSNIIVHGILIENGNPIAVKGSELKIVFDERKDIKSFSEVFGYILDLCKFLAFRKNVRFGEIFLEEKSKEYSGVNEDIAKCFVYYDDCQEIEKPFMSCITFNDIGDGIDKLLSAIVTNRPKKPKFNIGFIPENDKDVKYVTSMKIREVCSALESEMELAKIKVAQENDFENLVENLKEIVTTHRDGKQPLKNVKSYDYILDTLKHLKGTLADRIEKCFLQYQQEIGENLSREQINTIVKYRNKITHGNYMQLSGNLADTTFILIKLVYCCILERIGMSKDKIKDMMDRRVTS